MRKIVFLITFAVAGCALSIGGSNTPTDHTYRLTAEDIKRAEEFTEKCALDWVGLEPEENKARALEELKKLEVKIVERNPFRFTTALANRLLVGKGFWDKPVWWQAEVLTHEIVHYCEREIMGDDEFNKEYLRSAGRWVAEIPAEAQLIRTAIAQGASLDQAKEYIGNKMVSMQKFYWLFDINPVQYEEETRKIWSGAAGL